MLPANVIYSSKAYSKSSKNLQDTQQQAQNDQPAAEQPLAPLTREPQPPCTFNPDAPPEMVALNGGTFMMGAADNEQGAGDEKPRHSVTVQPFAISRCEITVAQFRQFVQETGYITLAQQLVTANEENSDKETNREENAGAANQSQTQTPRGCFTFDKDEKQWTRQADNNWQNPGFNQTENMPVTCISWQDASEYALWLALKTGMAYRLPTEAEWEYAARSQYSGRFSFGDDAGYDQICDYANIADVFLGQQQWFADNFSGVGLAKCNDMYEFTAPVANYLPNGYGLYDMHGNVWEWTQDCWHANYNDAPVDGSAWLTANNGDCQRRVVRGGAWFNDPQLARSAGRFWNIADEADGGVGFRVARTL